MGSGEAWKPGSFLTHGAPPQFSASLHECCEYAKLDELVIGALSAH